MDVSTDPYISRALVNSTYLIIWQMVFYKLLADAITHSDAPQLTSIFECMISSTILIPVFEH